MTTNICDQLDAEWRRITIDRTALELVGSWQLSGGPVTHLDELLARCGHRHPGAARTGRTTSAGGDGDGDGDGNLLELLQLARREQLAGRIVLQRILPGLVAFARIHAGCQRRNELLDELVANAWPVIRAYPIERRPRRVVSNLVRDVGFATIVRPMRRRSASEVPMANSSLCDTEHIVHVDPLEELVQVLGEARRAGLDPVDLELARSIANHPSSASLATQLGVTDRTVRNRREAVAFRLRALVAA